MRKLIMALTVTILSFITLIVSADMAQAAPVFGANHDGEKYSREIDNIETYTQKTLEQISKNTKALAELKLIYERLDRQIGHVTTARSNLIETCRAAWDDKDKLADCVIRQKMSLTELSEELNSAIALIASSQLEVRTIYGQKSEGAKDTLKPLTKLADYELTLKDVQSGVVLEVTKREQLAREHYKKLYGEAELARYQALIAPYDNFIVGMNFINEMKTATPALRARVDQALAANRYLQAVNSLAAMEWLAKQWPHMLHALPERVQKAPAYQKMFAAELAKFNTSLMAAQKLVELAGKHREQMLTGRLPLAVSEVNASKLLVADQKRMLELLTQSERYLAEYKKTGERLKLQTAEVVMERVGAWLAGEF